MFKEGDSLTVCGKTYRFLQETQQHGSSDDVRITYGGIAADEADRKYYIKYAGPFEKSDKAGTNTFFRHFNSRWEMIDIQGNEPRYFASPFLTRTVAHEVVDRDGISMNVVVLEYAEGVSLPDRIQQILKMDDKEKTELARFDLVRQLLLGIRDYSEGEDGLYVHRDLKPENIRVQTWLDQEHVVRQQLRILDFDFLLGPDDALQGSGGTPGYTHPDLFFGTGLNEMDPQKRLSWDLYSAGMIICYIMEGRPYFSKEEIDELVKAFKDGGRDAVDKQFSFGCSSMSFEETWPEFGKMVRDMISRNQVRYYSIDDVIKDFNSFLHSQYGENFAQNLRIERYLEHIPAQEESEEIRKIRLFCEIHENDAEGNEAGIPYYRSFTLYDGSLLRLTYGNKGNICSVQLPDIDWEIGAVSYLSGDVRNPVCFIPYSDAAQAVTDKKGKLSKIIFEDRDYDGQVCGTLEIKVLSY